MPSTYAIEGINMAQADTRYLKRQHQGWYFVTAVPKSLRGRFISQGRHGRPGRPLSKIVISLGTQSLSEAQERRWPLVHEWRERFKRTKSDVPFTLAEVDALARESYAAMLGGLDSLAKRTTPGEFNRRLSQLASVMQQGIAAHGGIEPFLSEGTDADYAPVVASEIARIEARTGIRLDPSSETYAALREALVRARLAAIEGRLRAAHGQPSEPPTSFLGARGVDPVTLRPIAPIKRPQVRVRADDDMKFSEAAALYLDEIQHDKNAALTEQTRGQAEAVFRLFKDYSDDAELSAVNRAIASDFLSTIARLHPHWGRSVEAKSMSLDQLLEKFGDKDEGLSNRTINRYVTSLSSVFKWARNRGHFDGDNPFTDQARREADTKKVGWVPYTTDELNTLFRAPMFNVSADDRTRPAKHTVETALRWVPLIALYSGMRLGEICQLRTGDVQRDGKIWFFRVSEEIEGQSVKTAAGIRRVPVHSVLLKCGMLEYLRALPAGALWPALKPGGPDGKLSWYLSKRFTEFRRTGGINRPRLSFHSLRKNFATALDNAGATRDDIAALIGHERGFTLETYSGGKGLKALQALMQRVKYPQLRLQHLYV
jgi:integrase